MNEIVHVFDYLASVVKVVPKPVIVLSGPEAFLKQLALRQLKQQILGPDFVNIPLANFDGATVEWRDVHDELSTISLFGGGIRVAIVDDAGEFISRCREKLEDYVARPSKGSTLILLVDSWPSNTRLFKAVAQHGVHLECRPPELSRGKNKVLDESRVIKWLIYRAKTTHAIQVPEKTARAILELVGPEFGLLEQELAKLALFVQQDEPVSVALVHEVVGGWRTKTAWELIEAAASGNTADAMRQLDSLLTAGQEPIALMGAIHWSLRRFATASRIIVRGERIGQPVAIAAALQQAGFRAWPAGALELAERQLLQLGRERSRKMYRWLLETDLALKGSHSTPDRARLIMEQLLVKMSHQLSPQRQSAARR